MSVVNTLQIDPYDKGSSYPIVAITVSEIAEIQSMCKTGRLAEFFFFYRALSKKRGLSYNPKLGIITWRKGNIFFQRNFSVEKAIR